MPLSWNTVNSRGAGSHRFLIWYKDNNFNSRIEAEITPSLKYGRRGEYRIKGQPARELKGSTRFLLIVDALDFFRVLGATSGANGHCSQSNM